jgi:hypothetical protein
LAAAEFGKNRWRGLRGEGMLTNLEANRREPIRGGGNKNSTMLRRHWWMLRENLCIVPTYIIPSEIDWFDCHSVDMEMYTGDERGKRSNRRRIRKSVRREL